MFRAPVLARIIEATSKLDSLRVLEEVGVDAPSYATLKRRLPGYAKPLWRKGISATCAAHAALGSASLVLYDRMLVPQAHAVARGVQPYEPTLAQRSNM